MSLHLLSLAISPVTHPYFPARRKTAIYASGAGLGASKGKEVGKYTEGYSGYVNMAKDLVNLKLYDFKISLLI